MKSKSRIEKLFTKDKARIAYLTAGDGGIKRTLMSALALIDGGVNLLELGVPFSDPIADGKVIERAARRALNDGLNMQDIIWLIKEIRKVSQIPLILFSYLNPILSAINKESNFLKTMNGAGLDGLLLVDCPLEESDFIKEALSHLNLDLIYIITANTNAERIKKVNEQAQGFLYYVCQTGTTGIRDNMPQNFKEKIQLIKTLTDLPVVVGFGISNSKMVKEVLNHADGVVIGSYFIKLLEDGVEPINLTQYAKQIFYSEEI